jgi:energy-converting hydrogenase A subunit P
MAAISLNSYACVRSLQKNSTCSSCFDVCPVDAIEIISKNSISLPSLNLFRCVGCAGCVSICPSSALRVDEYRSKEFFFNFLEHSENIISCQMSVPCLAAISVEELISLSILKDEVILDSGHCGTCDIAKVCKEQIDQTFEEAIYLLDALECDHKLQMKSLSVVSDQVDKNPTRRDFFNTFTLKNALQTKSSFEKKVDMAIDEFKTHTIELNQIKDIRQKSEISNRRKFFYMALKRLNRPSTYHVIDAKELSFTSLKLVDEEKCTACQMCYRICPTKALSSDAKNSKIDFDSYLCINCNSCVDVCDYDAIASSPSFNIKDFFEPTLKRLITFNIKLCNMCGGYFSSIGGALSCKRCAIEEEHARELWGI